MYSVIDISKYIISKCTQENHPISNLQLQKILYYVQKEYIKKNSRIFLNDIEAWQFGPVVPEAYYRFSGFGAMPITMTYDNININKIDRDIIDPIVENKRILNPWTLVDETHKANGAWDRVYKNGLGNHCVIPSALIKAED